MIILEPFTLPPPCARFQIAQPLISSKHQAKPSRLENLSLCPLAQLAPPGGLTRTGLVAISSVEASWNCLRIHCADDGLLIRLYS